MTCLVVFTTGFGTLIVGLGTLTVTFGLGTLMVGRGMFGLGMFMTGFGISTASTGVDMAEIERNTEVFKMARRDKLRTALSQDLTDQIGN
jgi:hypothetical protein